MGRRPIAFALFCASAAAASAQSDAVAVAPEVHRVVIENAFVRVLETRFAAGHPVPSHTHRRRVVVVLSASRVRNTRGDGKMEIADHRMGDVFWSDATEHSIEVIAGVVHEIETEIKEEAPPRAGHTARDVAERFPELARVLLENDRVRVIDLRGEAGQGFPFHFHPARVIVNLGSARSVVTIPNKAPYITDYHPAAAYWAEPIEHSDAVLLGIVHNISIEIKSR